MSQTFRVSSKMQRGSSVTQRLNRPGFCVRSSTILGGSRDVEVVRTTPTLFTFLARPNHALATGGTVTFKMYEKHYDDGSDVYLSVSATQSVSGVESVVPGPVSKSAANMTWSGMVAAFRCEDAYIGQEQYRRC